VTLERADACNYILADDEAYDVIISESSNPRITGIFNLFTRAVFELVRSRLKPGKIAAQWFHV